jgi:hypothetical protein
MWRICRGLSVCVLSLSLPVGAWAQSVEIGKRLEKPFFVTQEQVRVAVLNSLQGTELGVINFSEADVVISTVPTKVTVPNLRVTRVAADFKRGLVEVRLRCQQRECLPFCASVRPASWPVSLSGKSLSVLVSPVAEESHSPGKRKPKLVNAGDVARLFVVAPGIRISIPVICLQAGEFGQFIRLRAVATKTVLMGKVESKGVLSSPGADQ